jgi:hypothetical protein
MPVSMVRFRCKSCPTRVFLAETGGSDGVKTGARPAAGECGVKDQVSRISFDFFFFFGVKVDIEVMIMAIIRH